jgi:predicted MPP superfamily phosphohydrolase
MILRISLFILFVILIDFYAFQSFRTLTKNRFILIAYWLISIGIYLNMFYQASRMTSSNAVNQTAMLSMGLFILLSAPKIIIATTMLGEDLFRVIKLFFNSLNGSSELPSRRAFISKIALGLAAIPFASIIYGMQRGKYNYQVVKHDLFFDDLPTAFDGYKITHISDIHSGSFDNAEKVAHGIDLINNQNADIISFTGDLVNKTTAEVIPWIPYFKKLKAKDGLYSVLGNHDYGDYAHWNSPEEKQQDLEEMKKAHKEIGFDLLLNEHRILQKGNQKIALIGVENWGTKFKKAGDLNKASLGVEESDFKVLMSHDPSHWNEQVKKHKHNYHLTLSGHTHGMQFGIEIPGIKWSPVKYVYKQWAGIYKEFNRYINVNRGFGYIAFPGRVGIWPEITVITLKKGSAENLSNKEVVS